MIISLSILLNCAHKHVFYRMWIGVNDKKEENKYATLDQRIMQRQWFWQFFLRFVYESDGTNFAFHISSNQPNYANQIRDCVSFFSKTAVPLFHPFSDVRCHGHSLVSYFVCQSAPLPCYVPIRCGNGYKQIRDRCYKLHPEAWSYVDAQKTCESEGATLIEPRSQVDLNFLESEWGHLGKRWG